MTFFKGHPLGFLHPVNIIKTLPNNEEKGLRASQLKKPEKAERLYLNAYINNMGKTDLNLNLTQQIGKKWSTALLLHDDFLSNKTVDFNKDGFRDLPTGNLFSAVNRWKYEDGKGFMTQFGFKMLTDNRTGGETGFNPDKEKFTTNHYGLGIETKRYEGFAKIVYVFPEKKYKSIGLQLSVFDHQQDSYFGMTRYNATQQNFYANLIYQSIIGSTVHKFRTGLSFTSDKYNEDFRNDNYKRTEAIPGGFFEYTFTPVERFNIVAGIRADRNSLFGGLLYPFEAMFIAYLLSILFEKASSQSPSLLLLNYLSVRPDYVILFVIAIIAGDIVITGLIATYRRKLLYTKLSLIHI